MAGPVSLAVLGAGSRGRTLSSYAQVYPERVRVVAVADPVAARRDALGDLHAVPPTGRFADWRELAGLPRLADAVLVATPDAEHVGPGRRFAELGYDVLLEKPIAPTEGACRDLVDAVEAAGVIFGVCHVLRYTPYTELVVRLLRQGRLGRLVGVEHLEPVGWWHFAHSYVRGNWRRVDGSGPSLLTKSCHDLDWLRHIVDRPALRVFSAGGLHEFTPANRPTDAADRCLDCRVEPDCPYSAKRLYLGFLRDPERVRWPLSVLTAEPDEPGVLQALRDGPYGRCVYACDNDVADHQSVTIEFTDGVTATLTMSAFTPMGRRRTRIMGTRGFLDGDGSQVTVTDFVTGATETLAPGPAEAPPQGGGHGGGDFGVMAAFLAAVSTRDRTLIRSGARESLESHLMAFAAERSRHSGSAERVWGSPREADRRVAEWEVDPDATTGRTA